MEVGEVSRGATMSRGLISMQAFRSPFHCVWGFVDHNDDPNRYGHTREEVERAGVVCCMFSWREGLVVPRGIGRLQ
jgi:hypothetical protein